MALFNSVTFNLFLQFTNAIYIKICAIENIEAFCGELHLANDKQIWQIWVNLGE